MQESSSRRGMHVALLLLGAAVLVAAVPLMRQHLRQKPEAAAIDYRQGKLGTPGTDGWVRAGPAKGGWSVELPGRYVAQSQSSLDGDRVPLRTDSVSTQDAQGARYGAVVTTRLDGSAYAPGKLAEIQRVVEAASGKVQRQSADVLEATMLQGKRRQRVQVRIAGPQLYQLVADWPENVAEPAAARRMIDSLVIGAPESATTHAGS